MSIVITPETKEAWNKAIAKAKQVKPYVKTIGFGQFDVTGSKGETYRVSFTWNEGGAFEVSCSCQGHQRGLACYHCPPCGSIFKHQVAQRSEARKASEPTLAQVQQDEEDLFGKPLERMVATVTRLKEEE